MFHRILLAVDGSDHALKAAALAGELARLSGAHLFVMTTFEAVPAFLGEPHLGRVIADRFNRAEKVLAEAVKAVGEIPGTLDQETLEGPPAEAILRFAESRSVDLIVMGTRGLGQLSGLLMGSQSQKVIQLSRCPVLLAR